jgi:hypothetical protein
VINTLPSATIQVAIDSNYVYWTAQLNWAGGGNSAIMRAPVDGGSAVSLIADSNGPTYLAVNSSHIAWATNNNGQIMTADLDGGNVQTLATNVYVPLPTLLMDEQNAYWFNDNEPQGIEAAPFDGGAMVQVTNDQSGSQSANFALGPDSVAWSDGLDEGMTILAAPLNGGTVTTINNNVGSLIDGGPLTTIAAVAATAGTFTADSTNVYWNDYASGTLVTAKWDGTGLKTLLSGVELADNADSNGPSNDYTNLVADNGNLYFIQSVFIAPNGSSNVAAPYAIKRLAIGTGNVTTLAQGFGEPSHLAVSSTSVAWNDSFAGTVTVVTPK